VLEHIKRLFEERHVYVDAGGLFLEPYNLITTYYKGDRRDKNLRRKSNRVVKALYEKGYLARRHSFSGAGHYWKVTVTPDYGVQYGGTGQPTSLKVGANTLEVPEDLHLPLEFSIKLGRQYGDQELNERLGTSTILQFNIDLGGPKRRTWVYKLAE
jgi:hypothetical protein